MQYKKINNLLGWLCFVIASITYILTLEPSVSFWDCGEFISCAYRLQVAHQPGYPVFAMLGKVFSLLSMGEATKCLISPMSVRPWPVAALLCSCSGPLPRLLKS